VVENGYARDLMGFVRSHEKFTDKYDANFDLDFYESDLRFHIAEYLPRWNIFSVISTDLKTAAVGLLGNCSDEDSIVLVGTSNGFREIEFSVSWSYK